MLHDAETIVLWLRSLAWAAGLGAPPRVLIAELDADFRHYRPHAKARNLRPGYYSAEHSGMP